MKTTKFRACHYDCDVCVLTNPIAQPLENQKHAWPLAPVRLRPGSLTAAISEGNGHQGSKGTGVGTCKTKYRRSSDVLGVIFTHRVERPKQNRTTRTSQRRGCASQAATQQEISLAGGWCAFCLLKMVTSNRRFFSAGGTIPSPHHMSSV